MNSASPEIIVALDVPTLTDLGAALPRLPPSLSFYKIGLELFTAEGPQSLKPLKNKGHRIFLDLKLHDIPRTVAHAVASAAALGVNLLTVHATGGRAMLREAARAAKDTEDLKLLAVTTLTSLDQDDLRDIGIERPLSDQALALADLALESGIDGLVTSVHECAGLRETFGPAPILVTPGIRLPGEDSGDQKRIATPRAAAAAGSSYLVIGRPILHAIDPAAATKAILDDLASR